jgi:prolycopene isomerase
VDDPVYAASFPGLDLAVPSGQEPFLEAHLRRYPNDAAALRRLTELAVDLYLEMQQIPLNPRPLDLVSMPRRFPLTWQYRSATLQDVLDAELTDARLKSACCALWYWIGTPPSRQPFLYWASMMTAFIRDGACYPRGGYQRLADALVIGLEKAGGELLTGIEVSQIVVDRGRVGGVELSNGQRVTTHAVVSTGDPRDTFGRLVARDSLPRRYRRRVRRLTTSLSVYAMYAATDLDVAGLGVHHDTSIYTEWDHDTTWRNGLAGKPSFLSVRIPTLTDPSLAPPGQHIVILKAMAPGASGLGHADDEDRGASLIELAGRVLPGLGDHLTYVDRLPAVGDTPGSPLHLMGPIYGWEAIPSQIAARRLAPRTPIKGLLLAGQWTQPGHGLVTVAQSGLGAARLILGTPSTPPLPLNL